jgi:hypothetical protein
MIDPNDAPGIKVPIAILASGDENVDDVRSFTDALKVFHYCEIFDDQVHVSEVMVVEGTFADDIARAGWLHGIMDLRSGS